MIDGSQLNKKCLKLPADNHQLPRIADDEKLKVAADWESQANAQNQYYQILLEIKPIDSNDDYDLSSFLFLGFGE